ncbi:rhomboid family protein [Aquimarina sp. AD1]|nr:rhomboid family protein [Aquimarina sp. AD1]
MISPILLITFISIPLIIAVIVIFVFIKWLKPDFLQFKKSIKEKPEGLLDIDDRYNSNKIEKEKELNDLLDKINKQGIDKLTKIEKERLEELSK